jgi:hypothetical protein
MKRILAGFSLKTFILVLIMSLLVATACVRRPSVPTIRIISPVDGSTIPAGNVTVTVLVSNFNLVNRIGQPNVPGEGHIHYFKDAIPPTQPGLPAVTGPGKYYPTSANTYTWEDVEPGSHVFWAELVNSDLTPLYPPVVAGVAVTVEGGTPTPSPTP